MPHFQKILPSVWLASCSSRSSLNHHHLCHEADTNLVESGGVAMVTHGKYSNQPLGKQLSYKSLSPPETQWDSMAQRKKNYLCFSILTSLTQVL